MQHGIFLRQRINLRLHIRQLGAIGWPVTERFPAHGVEGVDRATALFFAIQAKSKAAIAHPRFHPDAHFIPKRIAGRSLGNGRIPLLAPIEPRFAHIVFAVTLALENDRGQIHGVCRATQGGRKPQAVIFLDLFF